MPGEVSRAVRARASARLAGSTSDIALRPTMSSGVRPPNSVMACWFAKMITPKLDARRLDTGAAPADDFVDLEEPEEIEEAEAS